VSRGFDRLQAGLAVGPPRFAHYYEIGTRVLQEPLGLDGIPVQNSGVNCLRWWFILSCRFQLGGPRKDGGSRMRGPATYDPKDKMAFFKDNVVSREELVRPEKLWLQRCGLPAFSVRLPSICVPGGRRLDGIHLSL
jgi:hypothetical protein